MTGTKAAPRSNPMTHLRGDPKRRVPRTRCGIDLTLSPDLPVTYEIGEVTCGGCHRLNARYG